MGRGDPRGGRARHDASAVSAEELLAWCRDEGSLPSVKRPERIELVDALPKNATGKIAKNELRDRYWTGARRV